MTWNRSRFCFFATVCLFALVYGCHDSDRYVFSSDQSISVDQLFTLTAEGDSTLPADGFSSVRLVAQVGDVTEGRRSVLFVTSGGGLRVGSGVPADSAVVVTDSEGKATVDLVSDREAISARVVASVLDVVPALSQVLTIRFVPVSAADVLTFVSAPDTAVANGLALSVFTVQISPDLEGEDRQVLFVTTGGTFEFSTDGGSSRTVLADASGLATGRLRSPVTPGEAVISATVKGFTQETTVRFRPVPVERMVSFVSAPDAAVANGLDLSVYTVQISPDLEGADRQVLFVTTGGAFEFSTDGGRSRTILADGSGLATVRLRSPVTPGEAVISATVKGFTQETTVRFTPVPVERMVSFVSAPDTVVANGLDLSVYTVQISPDLEGEDRRVTFVTTGGVFEFSTDGGRSRAVLADGSGLATVRLRSPVTPGEAVISATVKGFTQETTIRFVPATIDSIVRFVEAPDSAFVDGPVSVFTVQISPDLEGADRQVLFVTTGGAFEFSTDGGRSRTVLADGSGLATVRLRSPVTPGEAVVTATVKGFTQETTIRFVEAPQP